MSVYRQRCAECGRSRSTTVEHISAIRIGGGTYRRPPRRISSTICVPCAEDLAARPDTGHKVGAGHWDRGSIKRALERREDSKNP